HDGRALRRVAGHRRRARGRHRLDPRAPGPARQAHGPLPHPRARGRRDDGGAGGAAMNTAADPALPARGNEAAWLLVFACWLLATVSALGALFFSEVMELPPFTLCWYQRIFMFPLVILL